MCGIFGIAVAAGHPLAGGGFRAAVDAMFRISASRGKEASGLALLCDGGVQVHKRPLPADQMIRAPIYRDIMAGLNSESARAAPQALVGHSRLATHGLQGINANNQPVEVPGMIGVHNGIIVNYDKLFAAHPEIGPASDLDSVALFRLLDRNRRASGDIAAACRDTFAEAVGSAAIGALMHDQNALLVATNNGSLYFAVARDGQAFAFMSEQHMMQVLLARPELQGLFDPSAITHLAPRQAALLRLDDMSLTRFDYAAAQLPRLTLASPLVPRHVTDRVRQDDEARRAIRRCTRCILPETMPFIAFDAEGVCNYCHAHQPFQPKGADALARYVDQYRKPGNRADVLLPFSGGRDSSYALHHLVAELGMKPIAYTYDWGMVNSLSRRNQARMVGKLGIEHIIVSADIKAKRRNIRKNVQAWTRQPELGMVPLFMAGDKQFFYYCNRVARQTDLGAIFWADNKLERTNFKTGFCGLKMGNRLDAIENLTAAGKLHIAAYYARNFATNPGYWNASLPDTAFAYLSYYLIRGNYAHFFDYVPWVEEEIVSTLVSGYGWETAGDSQSTWRIGDGTAPFYNYIYYTAAGFTEHDTFRANQIREGQIDRAAALALVEAENRPRYGSILEYCQTLGLDFDDTIAAIDCMPRLYKPV